MMNLEKGQLVSSIVINIATMAYSGFSLVKNIIAYNKLGKQGE
jgi:hypothetical protein